MIFSKKLAQLRKSQNKTQADVARILGIPKTTYASYEQGQSEPNIANLTKLAICFDVSVDLLVGHRPFSKDGKTPMYDAKRIGKLEEENARLKDILIKRIIKEAFNEENDEDEDD